MKHKHYFLYVHGDELHSIRRYKRNRDEQVGYPWGNTWDDQMRVRKQLKNIIARLRRYEREDRTGPELTRELRWARLMKAYLGF